MNICLSLYSTRLILDALSVSDYGIYAVVGGVVVMLGFLTNGLLVTTQRYISYYHGRNDRPYVAKVFANSLVLHVAFGLAIALILVLLKAWFFGGVLNIPSDRVAAAEGIYYVTIALLFVTIVISPYKASFVAHEDIVYVSVIEIFDGIIKLMFAFILAWVSSDRLIVYGFMMLAIQVMNLLAFSVYGTMKYDECRLHLKHGTLSASVTRQLMGFAGWTIYSMGTLAARNQGVAIVINHFFGTIANAALGVSAQVNGAVLFVSSSIINAMNPQIMKTEGSGDRQRVLLLASQESKYSSILLLLVSIPLLTELPNILPVWLKEVPDDTVMFCSFALVTCIVDQFTIGLNTVNRAQGQIGLYTILLFTPKLLCLPIGWWLLDTGHTLQSVLWTVFITEALTSFCRIPYLKYSAGLDIMDYLRRTLLPLLPLVIGMVTFCWVCTQLLSFQYRFLLTIPLSVLVGMAMVWLFCLQAEERHYILSLVRSWKDR